MKTRKYWIKVNINKIKYPDKIKEKKAEERSLSWKVELAY